MNQKYKDYLNEAYKLLGEHHELDASELATVMVRCYVEGREDGVSSYYRDSRDL